MGIEQILEKCWDSMASPLYYASHAGLHHAVQGLLEKRSTGRSTGNAQKELSDDHASAWDHAFVVTQLLEKGADVNAQGGRYGNALQAASYGGHDSIVTLLLEKGADVNAQGGIYCNALPAASDGGHDSVVTLLLEKGADVNAQGGGYGNALYAASNRGHDSVVTLLLEKGADVNAKGGHLWQCTSGSFLWRSCLCCDTIVGEGG
jgi:ankyrin repeat protein